MDYPPPSKPNRPKLPQKVSLVGQTIDALKEGLRRGFWLGELPGELELCRRLHVSRVTLRAALARLQREGWVRASQGKRRQIVSRRGHVVLKNDRVVLLSESPVHTLNQFAIFWMDCLREYLNQVGFRLEILVSPALFASSPENLLSKTQNRVRPAGWILYRSNERIQRWFSLQQLPCIIAGSRHSNVNLPAVDLDYRSTCHHAAGQFLARKHSNLAFLNPGSGQAGDLKSEEGYQDAARGRPGEIRIRIIRHDGTVQNICNKLDSLFGRPDPPTALLVSRPPFVLTAMSHLLRKKFNFPGDIALISRDDDFVLNSIVPSVARYSLDPALYARKLSLQVLKMLKGGFLAPDTVVTPSFTPGQTLG